MLLLKYSSHFKKDLKGYKHEKSLLKELEAILDSLIKYKKLPTKYRNHELKGEFVNCFECHIKPDVLLIYKMQTSENTLLLLRVGSHSELF
jgi:mRNA interferase YafQ